MAQETAVQFDLLQERLGGCVSVPPLIGQVLFGLVIDTHVDICHELTHRLFHLRLHELYLKKMVEVMLKKRLVQLSVLNFIFRYSGQNFKFHFNHIGTTFVLGFVHVFRPKY